MQESSVDMYVCSIFIFVVGKQQRVCSTADCRSFLSSAFQPTRCLQARLSGQFYVVNHWSRQLRKWGTVQPIQYRGLLSGSYGTSMEATTLGSVKDQPNSWDSSMFLLFMSPWPVCREADNPKSMLLFWFHTVNRLLSLSWSRVLFPFRKLLYRFIHTSGSQQVVFFTCLSLRQEQGCNYNGIK